MKRVIIFVCKIIDILVIPFTIVSSLLLKIIRRIGADRMKMSKYVFYKVGVFPIRNHYYEPMFKMDELKHPLNNDRYLPGIDMNVEGQLKLLNQFNFNNEILEIAKREGRNTYNFDNDLFGAGSADYLYNMIRLLKPRKIIEIGSGNSTLMALEAINKNQSDDSKYQCRQICIEPYERSWLEKLNVELKRNLVENIQLDYFKQLEKNDILFIDSSHIIRPQGDVIFEYLEILPSLNPGVYVHIHDIFTPKDYPKRWIIEEIRFWNEQYLLEAFLTNNNMYQIIGSLNYLHHHHFLELSAKCPMLKKYPERESSSFWLLRK
ncbi:MAG: class I SAM-dependent methyltransferase [Candidatus Lokiarchaeota archaeon]|nr:class I SAM-dependent methyltransferase [Candidatus Lokiarchaeota archaeon]